MSEHGISGPAAVSALDAKSRRGWLCWGYVRPRYAGLANLALFCVTVGVFAWLASFPQVGLCRGLIVGSILLSLFGVGGHAVITMWITYPTWFRDAFPWDEGEKERVYKAQKELMSTVQVKTSTAGAAAAAPSSSSSSSALPQPVMYSPLPSDDSDVIEAGHASRSGFESFFARIAAVRHYRPARICVFTLIAVGILMVYIMGIIGLWLQKNTVAPFSGNLALPGLGAATTLTRSAAGVIRIEAETEHDLWFAQGVAHAQTRLWQLDFQRRVGSGRLSEAVGDGGLDIDKLFRTLGVYKAAQASYDALPADSPVKACLDAYTQGVNAYITNAVSAGGYLPLEFRALGLTMQPWAPADSLVWAKIMSWDLSGNLDREMTRYTLRYGQSLSLQRVSELLPPFDLARFPTVLSDADLQPPHNATSAARGNEAGGRDAYFAELDRIVKASALRAGSSSSSSSSASSSSSSAPFPADVSEAVKKATTSAAETVNARVRKSLLSSSHIPHSHGVRIAGAVVAAVRSLGDGALALWDGLTGAKSSATGTGCSALAASSPSSASSDAAVDPLTGRATQGSFRQNRRVGASNNWVVSGNLTASGFPLLQDDPHLQLLAPSLWQLTHLSCPEFETIGASFAGLPGVVIGRNRQAAWSVTNTGVDVQDLFVMQDVAGDDTKYVFEGANVDYDIATEVIHVKGGDDVVLRVRNSRYGPVITDNGVMDSGVSGGPPLSLKWVSISPEVLDTTFSAFYALQRVSNWTSFREALALWTAPSQNVLYGDVNGNIGYQMPGYIPTRNASAGHDGSYPAPGTSSIYDWQAPLDYDTLPRTLNPPEGFIATANNQVVPPDFTPFITSDWDEGSDGYRAKRITQLIRDKAAASGNKLTVDDMAAIQGDTVSLFALDVGAALANVSVSLYSTSAGRGLASLLSSWDGNTAVGTQVSVLWAEVWKGLSGIGAKETNQDFWDNPVFILNALASDATAPDVGCTSQGYTSCGAYAAAVLDSVASKYGLATDGSGAITSSSLSTAPLWGTDVHRVLVVHEILHLSPLACVADREIAHGGDGFTVNVGSFSFDSESNDEGVFTQDHGPSYRQIVHLDPATLESTSRFIHPMGVDGAPFSSGGDGGDGQYANLLAPWAEVKYLPMSMDGEMDGEVAMTLLPQ
jgi:penicillin amidase